jgi:hypothetical protein
VPEQSFLYEYAPGSAVNKAGISWVTTMCLPFREGTTSFYTSGHTWDLGGDVGEVEVMNWIDDYEIEAPFDWWETYDDRTSYWDGTPMDASAYDNDLRIGYYGESLGKFSDGNPTWEVSGDWEIHHWRAKGDAEGVSPNPANQFAIEIVNVGRYLAPPHPDFTADYADSLENASTEEETNSIWSEIQSQAVGFLDFAENGWGSGLYECPSLDHISNESMTLQAREDHPNNREETIPEIELMVANADRQNILLNEGEIDIEQAAITPSTGPVNRETLPDHIQQISNTGSNAIFGTPFNWAGDLGNLWVRRAFAAAIDWNAVGGNAVGEGAFVNLQYQTGTSDTIAETWMPEEFRNNLHQWPIESDTELATTYMENAGYSMQGGTWTRPNGEEAGLLAKTSAGYGENYVRAIQTIKSQLDSFGLPVEFENISTSAFNQARDNMTYDFVYQWNNQRSPFEAYTASNGWWNPKIVGRDPDFPSSYDGWGDPLGGRVPDLEDEENSEGDVQPADTQDLRGQPLEVTIPTEVGNIDAPEQAGRDPDLSSMNMETKTFNLMEHLIELNTDPEITEDRLNTILQDLGWYHNYTVPDYWAFSYSTGVVGNVRDLNWAPRGSTALKTNVRLGANFTKYQGQSGMVMKKYDEEYPDP